MKKFLLLIVISFFIFSPSLSRAQNVLGQETIFNIESSYDLSARSQLTATLIKISPTVYWHIDINFWEGLNPNEQTEINQSLTSLAEEFETNIYPNLTKTFGSEWTPGIDKDTRITVLIHLMKKETGGYNNTADEYPKAQIPESNEREMLYLNAQYVNTSNEKVFLAHELVHLITFNQKDKTFSVSEDTWLNEARAEYSSTLLGYDQDYEGSNLQRRVKDFLDKPSDSLTEWRESPADYGVANLFIQYLVDHYGIKILTDSLKIPKIGTQSINTILSQQGFKTDFSQIFNDWAVTVLINNCDVAEKYCYFNQNLKNLRLIPLMNYLPFVGQSTLSVTNATKDWAGNWHKFIGGEGTLLLEFKGSTGTNFKIPYIIQDSNGNLTVNNLELDKNQDGKIFIADFGSKNVVLTIVPIAQNKTTGFSNLEPARTFSWSASTKEKEELVIPTLTPLTKPISQMSRTEILARIAEIQALILKLQEIISQITGQISCTSITQDLYFGMKENSQVSCLQEFLKSQGSDIYPEGLVTGNFGALTRAAVSRFQEKYAQDILTPFGLTSGTGYVGAGTRAKINELFTP